MRILALVGVLGLLAAACAPTSRSIEVSGGATVLHEAEADAGTDAAGIATAPETAVQAGASTRDTAPTRRAASQGGLLGTGDGPVAGEAPVLKLGTVLPLQGGQRDFGVPVLRATEAFIDELNARGGVLGHRVELLAYHACLLCQDEALQAVRRLVEQDKVFALVNTYPMVVAFQPVIQYLADQGVPLIQGGAENQTSDALSPVNFATAPTGAFYVRFLPRMAVLHEGIKKVGLTYVDVPTERNGVPYLREELARLGAEVVREEPIGAAEEAVTNMDGAITRMRAAGAEGVIAINPVLLVYGRLGADRQRWQVPWVGLAAWSSLVEDGCGRVCDDKVLTETAGLSWIGRQSPQMLQYIDTIKRRYPGGQITGHTLAAWVGMQVLVEGLVRAGTVDRTAFLHALESFRDVDLGTTSPLTFTPDRHLGGSASTLLKTREGRYVAISEPLSYGEADI